jgi:hypothetical protein
MMKCIHYGFSGILNRLSLLLAVLGFALGSSPVRAGGGPSGYIVVFNPNDPNSVTVANHYQRLRNIPERNMVPFPFPGSFSKLEAWDFVETLRAELSARGLSAQMQGIALVGSMPPGAAQTSGDGNTTSLQSFLFLSPNYSRGNYPTQVTATVDNQAYGRDSSPGSSSAVLAANVPINGRKYWPVSSAGYMGTGANSPREVLDYLTKARATDGTKPEGTIYWAISTDSARNGRKETIRHIFPIWRELGIKYEVILASWVTGAKDVVGGNLGIADVDPNLGGTKFVPGAWADCVTSFSGLMDSWGGGQVQNAEWIRGGAAGTAGTYAEPISNMNKFTHGHLHTHFRLGSNLSESFWKSINLPAEIIGLGDPLLQPHADIPEVAITAPAYGATVSGSISVAVAAQATGNKTLDPLLDLFVDGRKVAIGQPGEPIQAVRTAGGFELNTASMGDGWHEIRVAVYNDHPYRTQNEASVGVAVNNAGGSIALSGPASYQPDEPVTLNVTPTGISGLTSIQIRSNGRLLAVAPAAGGSVTISGGKLPYDGICALHAVGIKSGGAISSRPLEMIANWVPQASIEAPELGPGCAKIKYFANTTAAGFHWDTTPPTTEVIYQGNGTSGLNLTTGSIPGITASFTNRPGFEFDMLFHAPATDWYEFGCNFANQASSWTTFQMTMNGRYLPIHGNLDRMSQPVHLAAGWHRLRIRAAATKSIQVAFYGRSSSEPVLRLIPKTRLVAPAGAAAGVGSGRPPVITAVNCTANWRHFSLSATAINPDGPESDLTYNWSAVGGGASFTPNGTNAAKTTETGVLNYAGTYKFLLSVRNAWGTASATVTRTINQQADEMHLTGPATSELAIGQWYPVRAVLLDQFNDAMAVQPQITWSLTNTSAEVETLNADGSKVRLRPLNANATYTLKATGGGKSGSLSNLKSVANVSPTVRQGGSWENVPGPNKVILGSNIEDPDQPEGDDHQYLWTVVSKPAGQTMTIVNPTHPNPLVETSGPGIYTARLTVTDGAGASHFLDTSFDMDASGEPSRPPHVVLPQAWKPEVTVEATDAAASETGPSTGTFTFRWRGKVPTADLVVTYDVFGSAGKSTDYATLSGTVTIPVGQPSATVTVTPVNDTAVEGDELVTVALKTSTSYNIGTPDAASVTIQDNDTGSATVTVSATDNAATESLGNAAVFTVSRTGSTTLPLAVSYVTDGAATDSADYSPLPGIVIIPGGSATKTVTLYPIDDDAIEGSEAAKLTVAASSGYTIGSSSSATVTIADNDLPEVTVTASDDTAAEFGLGTGSFTITRTGPTSAALTIQSSVGGTATAGIDYSALPPAVTIPPGEISAPLQVVPIADQLAEGAETVRLTIAAGAAYRIGSPGAATVTLQDLPADTWRFNQFGANASNPAIAGDGADPDGDGLSNLLEFAVGLNPTQPSQSGRPEVAVSGDRLRLSFTRVKEAEDLTYRVEATEDLSTWSQIWSSSASPYAGGMNPTEQITVEDLITIDEPAHPKRFLRLRVTR